MQRRRDEVWAERKKSAPRDAARATSRRSRLTQTCSFAPRCNLFEKRSCPASTVTRQRRAGHDGPAEARDSLSSIERRLLQEVLERLRALEPPAESTPSQQPPSIPAAPLDSPAALHLLEGGRLKRISGKRDRGPQEPARRIARGTQKSLPQGAFCSARILAMVNLSESELRAVERIVRIHAKSPKHRRGACERCGPDASALDAAFAKLRGALDRRRRPRRILVDLLSRIGLTLPR